MKDYKFEVSFQKFIGIGIAAEYCKILILIPFVMIEISWRMW